MAQNDSGFQLIKFQAEAARQIADRFELLINDPRRPMFWVSYPVPYFQALSALTGAGKTAILAEAVAEMVAGMPVPPIVFWISKLKAVVNQTFLALDTGGRYSSLIPGFTVVPFENMLPDNITQGDAPLIVMSTVSYFNQDKDTSKLTVHALNKDKWEGKPWEFFEKRQLADGRRRPLIIVYDEAQNLTDVQTELLMGLHPEAFLVASATMTLRPELQKVLTRLKDDGGWRDKPPVKDEPGKPTKGLVTQVPNIAVVDAQLVKREVVIGGYDTTMEAMVDDMLANMAVAELAADKHKTGFKPRAIYVCQTNIDVDKGTTEDFHRSLNLRRAPPILIWRHLVANKVDPTSIAVYCDLKFDRDHKPPSDFHLYAGAEKDFDKFTAAGYRHIIFNQALEEGWDDPEVAFAYIDKTMGSQTQVEQVIGRVLRQAGTEHYPDPVLNRATFYVRLDTKQQFTTILEEVQKRLGLDPGGVDIKVSTTLGASAKMRHMPKKDVTVPKVFVVSDEASDDMDNAIKAMPNHLVGGPDTIGQGKREVGTVMVGKGLPVVVSETDLAHSNRVTARWLIRREMRTLYPRSLAPLDDTDHRFDAAVDRTSLAAEQFRALGRTLVDTFIKGSTLRINLKKLHEVGPVDANPAKAIPFKNALHDAYELNKLEVPFAKALDKTKSLWCRNPQNGGWSIPMLDTAGTYSFYPDFLVWKGKDIFALDPKGEHLVEGSAWRKVLSIHRGSKGPRVLTRLISPDEWTDEPKRKAKGGFTVFSWNFDVGKLIATHVDTVDKAVVECLKPVP